MYAVVSCLVYEHNLYFVALAAVICISSNALTVFVLSKAREGDELKRDRWSWIAFAAASGGFGIWATHFVAMIAYDPGFNVSYKLFETVVSLGIAIIASLMALTLSITNRSVAGAVGAGLIFGLGVSSMHFTGMSGIEAGGYLMWDRPLVLAAILICGAIAPAGFWLADRKSTRDMLGAAAALTLAIISLHFTAMGAVTVVPGPQDNLGPTSLSKSWMITTILVVCVALVAGGAAVFNVTARAERSTRKAKASFDLLVSGITDYAIYMLDTTGFVTNWNAGAQRAKGYEAAEIVGQHFSVFYTDADRARGLPSAALEEALIKKRYEAEGWRLRKDGTQFWASVLIQPIFSEGEHVGFAKITRDISDQKAAHDKITQVSRNLDLALESMIQGLCLFDKDEKLVLANQRYTEIFGFDEAVVQPGASYLDIVETGYLNAISEVSEARRRSQIHYEKTMKAIREGQRSLVHKIANDRTVLANFNKLADGGWVATFEDITERMQSEERIAFLAKNDSLTKLPNRPAFTDYATHEIGFAEHSGGKLAIIGLDLDRFKLINDQLGHAVGDRVLVELAARMSSVLNDHELVARFGGDEFAALKRFDDHDELLDFVERLRAELIRPVTIDEHRLTCGVSIGIARYPDDGLTLELLLANADLAMYRAKESMSEQVCFYERAMDDIARNRARMAKDLWQALDRGEFSLNYQVQKSVATGKITGYEALLRWQHPTKGAISPAEFIPVAEECGAIIPIGEWVLRRACQDAAGWQSAHKVAVNLSPIQFAHADIKGLVEDVLRATKLDPKRLELEITESSIIVDKERAMAALTSLKALGVSIAIDDFGTGYSSLDTLRSFPFDKIKLDRSFMTDLDSTSGSRAMIRAVLAMGHGLNIPILAEGVETSDQLEILRVEGCHEVQGYLLGRPGPMNVAQSEAA
jgi:diguanylate cyclase (GGDEF)-like protein/PAS domain S-box-containing protein